MYQPACDFHFISYGMVPPSYKLVYKRHENIHENEFFISATNPIEFSNFFSGNWTQQPTGGLYDGD